MKEGRLACSRHAVQMQQQGPQELRTLCCFVYRGQRRRCHYGCRHLDWWCELRPRATDWRWAVACTNTRLRLLTHHIFWVAPDVPQFTIYSACTMTHVFMFASGENGPTVNIWELVAYGIRFKATAVLLCGGSIAGTDSPVRAAERGVPVAAQL